MTIDGRAMPGLVCRLPVVVLSALPGVWETHLHVKLC